MNSIKLSRNLLPFLLTILFHFGHTQILPDAANVSITTISTRGPVDTNQVDLFYELFESKLVALNKYKVLERNNMDMILSEQGFQASGACDTESCQVEMGQLLGVEYIITGSINFTGDNYYLSFKIMGVNLGKIHSSSTVKVNGDFNTVLEIGINKVFKDLFGASTKTKVIAKAFTGITLEKRSNKYFISKIDFGSPADNVGLTQGMQIIALNNENIQSETPFENVEADKILEISTNQGGAIFNYKIIPTTQDEYNQFVAELGTFKPPKPWKFSIKIGGASTLSIAGLSISLRLLQAGNMGISGFMSYGVADAIISEFYKEDAPQLSVPYIGLEFDYHMKNYALGLAVSYASYLEEADDWPGENRTHNYQVTWDNYVQPYSSSFFLRHDFGLPGGFFTEYGIGFSLVPPDNLDNAEYNIPLGDENFGNLSVVQNDIDQLIAAEPESFESKFFILPHLLIGYRF